MACSRPSNRALLISFVLLFFFVANQSWAIGISKIRRPKASCGELNAGLTPKWNNLKFYYRMNGTGSIANNAALTCDIGPAGTAKNTNGSGFAYATGKRNNGLVFDGTDDHIDFGTAAAVTDLAAGTWAMWIKINSAAQGTILYKSDSNNSAGWYVDYNTYAKIGMSVVYSSANIRRYSNNIPANGTWFHFAVTWDGGGLASNIKVYVNGSEVSAYHHTTDSVGSHTTDAAQKLYFGRPDVGTIGYANANFDELGIWNVSLTAGEVSTLYANQTGCP